MELMADGLAPAEFRPGGARHHELAALPCVPMQFIFDRWGRGRGGGGLPRGPRVVVMVVGGRGGGVGGGGGGVGGVE